jgi:hypothetical protein
MKSRLTAQIADMCRQIRICLVGNLPASGSADAQPEWKEYE